jgi:hypothetical protein
VWKHNAVCVALALAACDHGAPEPGPTPDPGAEVDGVDRLAERLRRAEEVSAADFDRTLAPLRQVRFELWPPVELKRLLSSFNVLRTSLIDRFDIADEICVDDSWTIYSTCETGDPCLAWVMLAELRCLWWLAPH